MIDKIMKQFTKTVEKLEKYKKEQESKIKLYDETISTINSQKVEAQLTADRAAKISENIQALLK